MLMTTARNANLWAMLSDNQDVRSTVADMIGTMESIAKEDVRGFRLASMLDPTLPEFTLNTRAKPLILNNNHLRLFCNLLHFLGRTGAVEEVLSVDAISYRGVTYGTFASRDSRNSTVIFYSQDSHAKKVKKSGVIDIIFQHESSIYLVVQEHPPMERRDLVDPYRPFGVFAGYLCEAKPSTSHVIELSQVISHFALTELPDSLIHVMPVDRVSCQI